MRAVERKLFAKEVALEVFALMDARTANVDPLLDRVAAANYLSVSARSFDRERKKNPDTLAPAQEDGPLSRQWRKSTLDLYKYGNRDAAPAPLRKAS